MNICFLIPDGVGIRNYLYSPLISILNKRSAQITIWHCLEPEVLEQARLIDSTLNLKEFPFNFYKEEPVAQILRESVGYGRLSLYSKIKKNPTILSNWFPKKTLKGKILNFCAEIIGSSLKTFKQIEGVESLIKVRYRNSLAYKQYKEELKKINPDIIFCTHQRVPNAGIAMLAAHDLGIKTVAAIFSWDNLPKARLNVRGDYFLVWSDYMKKEMEEYFPDIPIEKIIVSGTPQFDFYRNSSILLEKSEFARENGLDASKHWICYSGDDSLTSPHDPIYLRDLAEKLKHRRDIQILFRPVPVEGHQRYSQILEEYSQIVLLKPKWKRGKLWNTYFPYYEDVSLLVNLAKHADAVVNVGSTMALDFAQFNKPGLYVNYEVKPDHSWSIEEVYLYQHFRSMDGLQAVGWINSPDEIEEKINLAIQQPERIGPDRLDWKRKLIFEESERLASERIADWFLSLN